MTWDRGAFQLAEEVLGGKATYDVRKDDAAGRCALDESWGVDAPALHPGESVRRGSVRQDEGCDQSELEHEAEGEHVG